MMEEVFYDDITIIDSADISIDDADSTDMVH